MSDGPGGLVERQGAQVGTHRRPKSVQKEKEERSKWKRRLEACHWRRRRGQGPRASASGAMTCWRDRGLPKLRKLRGVFASQVRAFVLIIQNEPDLKRDLEPYPVGEWGVALRGRAVEGNTDRHTVPSVAMRPPRDQALLLLESG
jgi:hypothetical protein